MARGGGRVRVDAVDDRDVTLPQTSAEMIPALRERLSNLDKPELVDLVVERVEGDYESVQKLLLALTATPAAEGGGIDTRLVAQRVRNVLASCPVGQDSWDGDDLDHDEREELDDIVRDAAARAEAGDARNAMVLLRIVLAAAAEVATDCPDDYAGELDRLVKEAAAAAARIALSAEIPEAERKAHAARLAEATAELRQGTPRRAVGAVRRALESGWDAQWLVAILDGTAPNLPGWKGDRRAEEAALLPLRYGALVRREDPMGRVRLASAFGDGIEAACAFVEAGRPDDAVACAKASSYTPAGILRLASTLWDAGMQAKALELGAWGLPMPGAGKTHERHGTSTTSLAEWVREAAFELNDLELADKAAGIAFAATVGIGDFRRGKQIAGDRWGKIREGYLAQLERSREYANALRILVTEGEYDRAIAQVGDARAWHNRAPDDVLDLMRKVSKTHPDWVIKTAHARANAVLEEGNSNTYRLGVKWLERSAVAHRASGRQEEWTRQIDTLLQRYSRKRNLKPMLLRLRANTVPDAQNDEPGPQGMAP